MTHHLQDCNTDITDCNPSVQMASQAHKLAEMRQKLISARKHAEVLLSQIKRKQERLGHPDAVIARGLVPPTDKERETLQREIKKLQSDDRFRLENIWEKQLKAIEDAMKSTISTLFRTNDFRSETPPEFLKAFRVEDDFRNRAKVQWSFTCGGDSYLYQRDTYLETVCDIFSLETESLLLVI